jgi:hypothetical protein
VQNIKRNNGKVGHRGKQGHGGGRNRVETLFSGENGDRGINRGDGEDIGGDRGINREESRGNREESFIPKLL